MKQSINIKPNENYHLLGTAFRLDKNKVYNGIIATNQPNYREKGLMFCGDILLNKNEYKIVEKEKTSWNNQ